MTKPNGKAKKLSEMRAQRADAVGGREFPVELEDGTIVAIPRQQFWPREVVRKLQAASMKGESVNDEDVLKMILPAADHKKLMAEATEIGDVEDIMREIMPGTGMSLGESQGSSTS